MSILKSVETAGKIKPQDLQTYCLIHGGSGNGKTTAAATAEKPLILLTESNGLLSIKNSNPNAKIVRANSIDEVRSFLMEVSTTDILKKLDCKTVVIDSMTEVQNMLLAEQQQLNGGKPLSIQHWQTVTTKMRKVFRMLRDLPCNVIAIALTKQIILEESGQIFKMPSFSKAIREECAGYFSIVGYCFKRRATDENGEAIIEHKILFRGEDSILCKTSKSLNDIEDPDFNSIFSRCASQPKN